MCEVLMIYVKQGVESQVVEATNPILVALHLQEVGGKDYEVCMPKVDSFVR